MAWTTEQSKAIEKRGVSLLVSAAAGSGKTAVITERVMQLLLDEGISLEEMLIVTFTNAAAGEMKERIGQRIKQALKTEDLPDVKKSFLRRQLRILQSCNISTFHKFGIEVIRRYYYVIGLKPGLTVCDSAKQELIKEEAMSELFADKLASGDKAFTDFLDRYSTPKDDENVKDMIVSFTGFLKSLPDPEAARSKIAAGKAFDREGLLKIASDYMQSRLAAASDYLAAASQLLCSLPGSVGLPQAVKLKAKNDLDLAAVKELAALAAPETAGDAALACESFKFSRMTPSGDEKQSWDAAKSEVSFYREAAKDCLTDIKKKLSGFSAELLDDEIHAMQPQLAQLCALSEDFDRRCTEKKLAKGLMDFSDIEHYALKILENESVCEEYRRSLRCIFIDEYQDSNMVQEKLISRVSRPDNLFMVGDVKQSIYKFRLAEPELFLEKYAKMKTGEIPGEVIDLNANFRSKSDVIDTVNGLFSVLMNEKSCGMVYDSAAALYEGVPYTGPLRHEPKFYMTETRKADAPQVERPEPSAEENVPQDEELEELKADELEALQAVRIIRSSLGRTIYDSKLASERPLGYKDMAILLPVAKGKGEIFYRALASAGIPVCLERSEGYFDTAEVRVFLNLIRLIDNRKNDIPLISILHFPAFGYSIEELCEIRLFASEIMPGLSYSDAFALYAEEGRSGALKEKCAGFLKMLSDWRKRSLYTPIADFLWEVLCESGILDCCSILPGGDQRRANLQALIDKAASYETESAFGLYGFIRFIEAVREKVSVGEAEIFSPDSDAVKIMTIHKSKGLEFPFVLVCGMGRKFSSRGGGGDPDIITHKHLGAAVKLYEPSRYLKNTPFVYRLIALKKKQEEMAERIRLLYVAATRARDILVFSAAVAGTDAFIEKTRLARPDDPQSYASFAGMLLPLFAEKGGLHIIRPEALAKPDDTQLKLDEFRRALENGFELDADELPVSKDELSRRLSYSLPSGPSETEKTKYSVSQLAELSRRDDEKTVSADFSDRFKAPAFVSETSSLGAAAKGTAYHSVMEHFSFSSERKDPQAIAEFVEKLERDGILSAAERGAIDPALVSEFFESDIGKRVCSSDRVLKEAPFTVKRLHEGRTVMVQGTIDCCFIEDGQWILVDYKSNFIDKSREKEELERLESAYRVQLAEYRYALETITKLPVKEAVLYLFSLGRELIIN